MNDNEQGSNPPRRSDFQHEFTPVGDIEAEAADAERELAAAIRDQETVGLVVGAEDGTPRTAADADFEQLFDRVHRLQSRVTQLEQDSAADRREVERLRKEAEIAHARAERAERWMRRLRQSLTVWFGKTREPISGDHQTERAVTVLVRLWNNYRELRRSMADWLRATREPRPPQGP